MAEKELEIETIEKEIEKKKMKMKILTLNKWITDAGYPTQVRALKRDETNDDNIIFKSSLGFLSPKTKAYKKSFNQIVSEVLRINVLSIKWSESDSVEIEYFDN